MWGDRLSVETDSGEMIQKEKYHDFLHKYPSSLLLLIFTDEQNF